VSLKEDSLRDTTVFNSVLKDMESIVVKIIINSALADTVVFGGVLNYGLLDLCLEMEHLKTKSLLL
jgi:hypothetical protein